MGGATYAAQRSSRLLSSPPALLFFVAERFWVSQRNYSVITGRGGAFARLPLPRLVTWALVAICVVIATLILSLYFGIIAGAFTETWGVDWTPTFNQWPVAFSKSDHLRNSVFYAATAGLAATFFAMPEKRLSGRSARDTNSPYGRFSLCAPGRRSRCLHRYRLSAVLWWNPACWDRSTDDFGVYFREHSIQLSGAPQRTRQFIRI